MPTQSPQPGDFLIWLLTRLSTGEKLTEAKALNRALVRAAVVERPTWFERLGSEEPNREFDVPPVEVMHEVLLGYKLVRRYKGSLMLTGEGKKLLAELLADASDQAASAFCTNLLYTELIAMERGSVEEIVSVSVCKLGASGNQLPFGEICDIVASEVRAFGIDLPVGWGGQRIAADYAHQIIWLMEGLDICQYESRHDFSSDRRLIFSSGGREVIRAAGITGRATII